jgi:hypothetical protein
MPVSAKAFGLPDREPCPADRFAIEIEDAPRNLDNFTSRPSVPAFDSGQICAGESVPPRRKIGT